MMESCSFWAGLSCYALGGITVLLVLFAFFFGVHVGRESKEI